MTREKNANILVTGGAGYIGSVLVPELLKKGHRVTVLDNFMYNQAPLLEHCYNDKLIVIRGDARDKDLLSKWIKNVDAIFPLACLTGAPLCSKDPYAARTTIVDAIKMMLAADMIMTGKTNVPRWPCLVLKTSFL